jgi:hypothetical protein
MLKLNKHLMPYDPEKLFMLVNFDWKNHILKLSQSSPAPLTSLGHFFILARVTSANPSHSAMLMVSSPKPRTPKFVQRGPTLLLSCTSPKGMSKIPWAQGGYWSDTRDLWRRW